MANDLWSGMLQATLALSLALVVLMVLRQALRRVLGARAAYNAWALAPLSVLAVWLPAPERDPAQAAVVAATALEPLLAVVPALPESLPMQALLIGAWGLGALGMALTFAMQQRRFADGVRRLPGLPYDETDEAGPAVTGLLRPRIVLPADFRERYSAEEQALVIAHERLHLERGDIPSQALATGLRCLFWFNPLVHAAAARFRIDQELACDAAVLARFPNSRRTYGGAMLKTQLAAFGLPLGCHWQSDHPLKERLAMLKQPLPGPLRRRIGMALVATLVAGAAVTAWATQTPASDAPVAPGPTFREMSPPKFPSSAKNAGVSGRVDVEVQVGVDGRVKDVEVVRSEPQGVFDEAAVAAVYKWTFNPAIDDATGKPVEGRVLVPITFEADGDPEISADTQD